MRKILLVALLLSTSLLFSQDSIDNGKKDLRLARIGKKIQGVYLFMGTEPFYKYKYVATVNAEIDYYNKERTIDKIIKKSKKKYPYFNGVIFYGSQKADLILFEEEEITRGGFVLGQEVTFKKGKTIFNAVIFELESGKNKATIKYTKKDGSLKVVKMFYGDLNPKI
jgi:hypothetical protein